LQISHVILQKSTQIYYATTTPPIYKRIVKHHLSKLDVLKATKLKQEGSAVSSEELEKNEYDVTTFRLYQVLSCKSGLFGSRD
jgi:hypothetical protein